MTRWPRRTRIPSSCSPTGGWPGRSTLPAPTMSPSSSRTWGTDMLRLALLSGRGRLGTFAGALVALFAASVLTTAWGMQLEAVLRGHAPVERYAGAAAVVTGQQIVGPDHDVPLGERARVSAMLASRLSTLPGVRAAIGDVSVPVRLGDREAVAHGWGSARLAPYVLTPGRPPAPPGGGVRGC